MTDELTGYVLGQYDIQEVIGKGGMATIYRATQTSIGRQVAVKVLPPSLLHNDAFLERFEREVKVIANLQHPHILRVFDFGQQDGIPFIVMEYIPGGTVDDYIAHSSGGLPLSEVIRLTSQIASALDYAHRQRVIHRDFKPSNVLLDHEFQPYLADFGIAKVLGSTSQITGSGVVGTPAFMAPEMTKSGSVTHLIDVYALGVTVFEMLTGQQPFDAELPIGVALAHITEPVPMIQNFRAELPGAVQSVMITALAKDPAERYQTAGELAQSLQTALIPAGSTNVTVPTPVTPIRSDATIDLTSDTSVDGLRTPLAHINATQAYEQPRKKRRPMLAILAGIITAGAIFAGAFFTQDSWLPLVGLGATETPTPTATALPTDPPTATSAPTETTIPTDAPTATDQPTGTPLPTDIPTATSTPTPTVTATPTVEVLLSDNFDGTSLTPARWFVANSGAGSAATVSGSILTLYSGTTNGGSVSVVSTPIEVNQGMYTIEARVKVGLEDNGGGAWGFIGSGLNGIAYIGVQSDSKIDCTVRREGIVGSGNYSQQFVDDMVISLWHTYRIELEEGEVRCFVDGELVATHTENTPWNIAMPVVLDRRSQGINATLQIDYIELTHTIP